MYALAMLKLLFHTRRCCASPDLLCSWKIHSPEQMKPEQERKALQVMTSEAAATQTSFAIHIRQFPLQKIKS